MKLNMDATLPVRTYFNSGWRIFEKNFPLVLLLVILIDIPLEIISFFFGPEAYAAVRNPTLASSILAILFVGISVAILKNISLTGVVLLSQKAGSGEKPTFKSVLSGSLERWWVVSLTNLLAIFVVAALLLLGIIPGIIMFVYFFFNIQAVVIDNKRFAQALEYSKNLIKGHWWLVLEKSFLIWLPITVTIALVTQIVYRVLGYLNIPAYFIPNAVAIMIGYYGWIVYTQFYLAYKEKHG